MSLVKVESFVYYEHSTEEYVLPHRHESYELVYYLSGRGEVNYLGEKHAYRADTASIVEPQTKHDEASAEPTNVYIVVFSAASKLKIGNIFLNLDSGTGKDIRTELKRAFDEYGSKQAYSKQMVNNLFEIVVLRLLRESGIQSRASSLLKQECAAAAKQYVKTHSDENIDFEQLAQQLGYSYHRFRHIFKEVTGMTLSAYLLEQRLSRAKELLETTKLPVAEVAKQVGFSSQQYFINFFRAHVGASPARYRQIFDIDNPIGVYKFK